MKWIDINSIAIDLFEKHSDVDPRYVNFVELHQWIVDLDGFDDSENHGGERILEAIQAAWIEESDLD